MQKFKRMKKYFFICLCGILMASMITGCGDREEENMNALSPVVKTPTGTYTGQINEGINEFLGIRYAAPTERWKAPTDITTTIDDEIDASEWGPACIQPYDDVELASQGDQSEDCLNLNIWTKDTETKDKPVMVFIHGGGFMNGGSSDPMYHGDTFVRNLPEGEDMVFVSINYRTNIFGSIDLTQLEGYSDDYYDSINLWLLDQIQALKWVNENIEAFGGDVENVTLIGQSCGAMSVSFLLSKEETHQYFQKAIIESGAPFVAHMSKEKKEEQAQMIFDILGVSNMEELLALSEEDINPDAGKDESGKLKAIFDNMQGLNQMVPDGKILPEDWWDKIREGSAKDIKVMIGTTMGENDWAAYDFEEMPNTLKDSADIWEGYLVAESSDKGGKDAKYLINPVAENGEPSLNLDLFLDTKKDGVEAMTDLYNAVCYVQGAEYMAEAQSKYNDTYLYNWTYAPDPGEVVEYCEANGLEPEVSPYGRALHCMDLLFAFGTTEGGYGEISGDPSKLPSELSPMTQATWFSFVKTGNPNNDFIPEWKKYDTTNRYSMIMDSEWSLEKDWRKTQREALTCRPQGEK